MSSTESAPYFDVEHDTLCGRYLRLFWQPVYRTCDLLPDRPVSVQVLGQGITLYRVRTGQAFALAERCPHRGTLLSLGDVCGSELRCLHHGYRFDGSGRCTEAPGENRASLDRLRVDAYAVREYLGLVFVHFGKAPPPLPRFEAFEEPGVLRVLAPEVWPCSYFERLQNSIDPLHVVFTHRRSGVADAIPGVPEVSCHETAHGIRTEIAVEGVPAIAPVLLLMPNLLLFQTPIDDVVGWRDHLIWRIPIDRERCVSFSVSLVPEGTPNAEAYRLEPHARPYATSKVVERAQQVLSGEKTLEDLTGEPQLTEIEDCLALVGLGSHEGRPPEHLGRADQPLILLRQLFRRELDLLAANREPKRWTYTSRVE